MAALDVFKADAFSLMSLLKAIENVDYKPQYLGSLGIFEDNPVDTRTVAVESRNDTLALIPTTPIGAPLVQRSSDKRTVRNFGTVRIAKGSRIHAESLQGIRAFGSETETEQVQAVVARRLQQLSNDLELTWEHHRLGAVQGIVLDADGSTVIYNYYDEFGVAQPSAVGFDLGTLAAGAVRPLVESQIVRPIKRNAKGAQITGIKALVGDDFWDALVNHAEIRTTYLNQVAASELREPTAFGRFMFAGVEWVNYQGTDDNSTVAIAEDEVKFFPVGSGIFEVAWAPAEFFDTVNRPGVPRMPLIVTDPLRNAWADVELYSYPLFICKRPLTLRSAVLTT